MLFSVASLFSKSTGSSCRSSSSFCCSCITSSASECVLRSLPECVEKSLRALSLQKIASIDPSGENSDASTTVSFCYKMKKSVSQSISNPKRPSSGKSPDSGSQTSMTPLLSEETTMLKVGLNFIVYMGASCSNYKVLTTTY